MSAADSVFVEAGARLHFGVLDLRGALGRRFGGLGAAIPTPSLLLEVARARAGVVGRGARLGPRGRVRAPLSGHSRPRAAARVSSCTGGFPRTAGWDPAPSSGLRSLAPWRSCTACPRTRRRWRARSPGAGAPRSGPGHSPWGASSSRADGGRGRTGSRPLIGRFERPGAVALRRRGAARAVRG